jgi:hypothetical protein
MTETLPKGTIAVFATLGGATVALIETPDPDRMRRGSWNCLGCGLDSIHTGIPYARGKANEHAGTCRSKPLPL